MRLFICTCILYLSEDLYIIQARGKVVKAAVEAFMIFTGLYETLYFWAIRGDGYAYNVFISLPFKRLLYACIWVVFIQHNYIFGPANHAF